MRSYENNIEVIMVNDVAVGGFQFTLTDTANLIILTGASGGSAENNDFTTSTSELGIVIGFSFTGDSISAGESLLTNLKNKIENRDAQIGVIGLGYVGLPLAMEFVRAGFHVTGIDIDQEKVKNLNRGENYIQDINSTIIINIS